MGLQGVTGCDSRLRGVTGDYKVSKKTSSLTTTSPDTFSWLILHNNVTKGYRGLQGVSGCDSRLQGVTGDYKVSQKTSSLTRTSPDTFFLAYFA